VRLGPDPKRNSRSATACPRDVRFVPIADIQLLNPAFPQREGTNVTGQKDAKGKLLHQEIIRVAETDGSGWVDYMFPKPGQTVPSQKWTFVKKVTIDGTPGLVASGFFPD
jgi:cytochrome c